MNEVKKVKKEYWPSGATRRAMTFIDDVQDGPAIEYYEKGDVKKRMEYYNGKIEGIAQEYYEGGDLWVEEIYRNGKLHGLVRSFYRTGNLQSELPYHDGKLSGQARVYYGSGILKKEARFKDGRQVGKAKIYTEQGKLRRKGDFFNEEDSRTEVLYEQGSKNAKVSGFKLFLQFLGLVAFIGAMAWIFDPGSGLFKGEEKKRVQTDLRAMGSPKRDPMLPPEFPRDGITRTYYESGKLYAEWSFKNQKQHGVTKKYYEDGSLQSEISYKNGLLDGPSIIYHASGRVISHNEYRDGILVKDVETETKDYLPGKRIGNKVMVRQPKNPDFEEEDAF